MQEMANFIKDYPQSQFEKGQVIFSSGGASDVIFVIATGFAKVSATDRLGNEQMLWVAGRLDIVPTEQLFSKIAHLTFSYSALSSLLMYKIPKEDFLAYAKNNVMVMQQIARGMSGHYDDLLYRLSSITQSTAREKITYTLNNIAERFSADDKLDLIKIGLNITHQDIAGMIHASRETASIELKKLKDEDVIFYDRTKFIIYTSRLRAMLEK